jgi:hypothetical protein
MFRDIDARVYFLVAATLAGLLVLSSADLSALRRSRPGRDAPYAPSLHDLRRQTDLFGP